MPKRKFLSPNQDIIANYRCTRHARNTLYATKTALNALQDFYDSLPRSSSSPSYDELDEITMNSILEQFYVSCRTINGQENKISSFRAMRQNLRRSIKISHNFDIIHDAAFISCNVVFGNRLKDLKETGQGCIDHHPDISPIDLQKIIASLSQDNPTELQLLVWFFIQLHFCNRGMENSVTTTKDHFKIVDIQGKHCIVQSRDELTKNHRENDLSRTNGAIIVAQSDEKCPVALFEKYLSKLDPQIEFLWQLPKPGVNNDESVWYKNKAGKNTTSGFMKTISKKCQLSKVK